MKAGAPRTAAVPQPVPPDPTAARRGHNRLARDLAHRLERGEHILLWGPRGSGKTTLLHAVQTELRDRRCGFSTHTNCLDDVTRALEHAYVEIPTQGLTRRAARSRLWWTAADDPAVLLLDHVTRVPTAMKGWFRQLRGGLAGVALVFDVDSPRERARLRTLRLGCWNVQMPPTPARSLGRQLAALSMPMGNLSLPVQTRRALIRAARGRPGWLVQCAACASDEQFWHDGRLRVHQVAWATELRLRGVVDSGVSSAE